MAARVDFWFEFASTYSYLSAMRIDAEARRRGVDVVWRPFLLGPIFASQGWNTSPFAIYPAKGRNMWRDMERRTEKYGLPFGRPDKGDAGRFPQNSVLAARVALVGLDAGWGEDFARGVYTAQFGEGAGIADPEILRPLIAQAGGDPDLAFTAAVAPENKGRLRANVEEAIAKHLYGAPSFTVGEELFWGDDRLEDALDWAAR
ncbi:MAG: 2-hydroxychromene-2-carboxylate isomerase [Pseudomonadota bacterium]